MGQTCCRLDDQGPSLPGAESWRKAGISPTLGTLRDLTLQSGLVGDSNDDFWEDARSVGSATTSHLSFLSVDDLLDQYQEDLHGDIHDLDEEVQEAAMTGGHLVPKEIEDAAAGGGMPTLTENIAAAWLTKLNKTPHPTSETTASIHVTSLEDIHTAIAATAATAATKLPKLPLPDFFSSEAALLKLQHTQGLIVNGRILEARDTLIHLCDLYNQNNTSIRENNTPSQQNYKFNLFSLQSLLPHSASLGIDIASLETDIQAVHAALDGLEDDSGWMVSRKGDLRVLYSHKKGTTEHSLKFHAVFPHPVEHILSLAYEWDLIPTWNKFTLEAIKLASPSIFESIVYGAQWMMKPFRSMQAIVRARGFDLAASPHHRCLLILLNDLDDTEIEGLDIQNTYPHLPEAMAKRKMVNIFKNSCIKLRPLPPLLAKESKKLPAIKSSSTVNRIYRTDAHLMVHLDPHIPYVPASLVNFVLGILAPYIYNQMLKVLDDAFKQADGVFPQRIQQQPELYGLVVERMAEFADEI